MYYFLDGAIVEDRSSAPRGTEDKVYTFICDYIDYHGIPPTHREIMKGVGLNALGQVRVRLNSLTKKGLITIEKGVSRGISSGEKSSVQSEKELPERAITTHRKCNTCNKTKPVEEMMKSSQYLGGYRPRCKACAREIYHQKLKTSPQIKARRAVRSAVQRGDLPDPKTVKCSTQGCDNISSGYHHYNGYSSENHLEVVPICNNCHGAEHREV